MENITRTALGTVAALVVGLAIGGGVGAFALGGGDDDEKATGDIAGGSAIKRVSRGDVPVLLVNRPGGGFQFVTRPGYKVEVTGKDEFHVINQNPPPKPPPQDSSKLVPVPQASPSSPPQAQSKPSASAPISPAAAGGPKYGASSPAIPRKRAKRKPSKACRKKPRAKKCKPKKVKVRP